MQVSDQAQVRPQTVFDAQFRVWGRLFGISLLCGLWGACTFAIAIPRDGLMKVVIVGVAALSGVVAAGLAFFIGISAGVQLPRN